MLIEDDLKRIQEDLEQYDTTRERMLEISRRVIRLASYSIVQIHRIQLEEAEETIQQIESTLKEMEDEMQKVSELRHHANMLTAYQEYVEAKALYTLTVEEKLCSLDDVKVPPPQYILGLLDVVGELRRQSLNSLKEGDPEKAEAKLKIMEGIYEDLIALNHATIISGFRHKLDTARRIIEVTRGDVVTELRRWSLEKAINGLYCSLKSSKKGGRQEHDIFNKESKKSSTTDG
jgi:translin